MFNLFKNNIFPEDKPDYPALDKLFGRDKATARNIYLTEHLSDLEKKLFKTNKMELVNKLEDLLNNNKTPLREDLMDLAELKVGGINFDLREFRNSQLIRVLLLANALKRNETVENIGSQIEADLLDEHEHGGVIMFDNQNEIYFKEIEQQNLSVQQYELPGDIRGKNKYIADYHLHAIKEDCSEFNGPSSGGLALPGCGGDIENSVLQNKARGGHHGVVITKLLGNKFSVVYYSTVGQKKKGIVKTAVCNIGDFEYSR